MKNNKKNAIIISLSNDISEIKQLASTLGYSIIKEFIQQRSNPDVNFYIGSGKSTEIQKYLEETEDEVQLVIVNGELKPSQWFFLEKNLHLIVYDRLRLILQIFEEHAERKEAKLQVRLAQLQYERPYVRELIHRTRAGEHPGYMAGGEYQVDDYYEMIKKQMKKISDDLEKISNERQLQRKTRYKSGFYLVSLTGYTNAGKSSLLNVLSNEKVKVEDQLFSTLSTTTRRIENTSSSKHVPILLTDTVGFIDNLPAWVIDAFHSTLEEIIAADLVVLVVDSSDDYATVERKCRVSLNELHDLGVVAPILIALNKIDLLHPNTESQLVSYLKEQGLLENHPCIPLSVKNTTGVNLLVEKIYAMLPAIAELRLQLPPGEKTQGFISELYEKTQVIGIDYSEMVTVNVACNMKIKEKIQARCREIGGKILLNK